MKSWEGSMEPNDELREKVEYYKRMGHQVPKWKYVKTPEQIEGIRASGVINTGVLDYELELNDYKPDDTIVVTVLRPNGDTYIDMDIKVTLSE